MIGYLIIIGAGIYCYTVLPQLVIPYAILIGLILLTRLFPWLNWFWIGMFFGFRR
jgi:hypothetical protein